MYVIAVVEKVKLGLMLWAAGGLPVNVKRLLLYAKLVRKS